VIIRKYWCEFLFPAFYLHAGSFVQMLSYGKIMNFTKQRLVFAVLDQRFITMFKNVVIYTHLPHA
jgi:hypothetical protein